MPAALVAGFSILDREHRRSGMPVDGAKPIEHDEDMVPATNGNRCLAAVLRMSGLRPTRQRLSLLDLIMSGPNRHFTIDELFKEARDAGLPLSLATVYNATRQFSEVGILRELPVDGNRTFYDTNTRDHRHYFLEEEQRLLDAPAAVGTTGSTEIPPGMMVRRIDVLIHLTRSGIRPVERDD
jgi:Fur family iron response transcriptional regulator